MILESADIKSNSLRTRGTVVVDGNVEQRQPYIDGRAAQRQMGIRKGRRVQCTTGCRHQSWVDIVQISRQSDPPWRRLRSYRPLVRQVVGHTQVRVSRSIVILQEAGRGLPGYIVLYRGIRDRRR